MMGHFNIRSLGCSRRMNYSLKVKNYAAAGALLSTFFLSTHLIKVCQKLIMLYCIEEILQKILAYLNDIFLLSRFSLEISDYKRKPGIAPAAEVCNYLIALHSLRLLASTIITCIIIYYINTIQQEEGGRTQDCFIKFRYSYLFTTPQYQSPCYINYYTYRH